MSDDALEARRAVQSSRPKSTTLSMNTTRMKMTMIASASMTGSVQVWVRVTGFFRFDEGRDSAATA
jgi:hypothetical protein